MGRKMVIVAGLLATSVMDVTIRQAIVIIANTGRFPNGLISSATQVDKPDTCGYRIFNTITKLIYNRILNEKSLNINLEFSHFAEDQTPLA